jgi:F-type H+-transporting ATPase subunit b
MTRWIVLPLLLVALSCGWCYSQDSHADEDHAAEEAGHDHAEGDGHDHASGDWHDHDAAGGHAAVNPNPLEIDPDLALVTLIIFLVLMGILYKFAWGPIMAGLHHRESHIAQEISAAEARHQEAQKLLADYQTQLAKAGDEVRAMIDSARKDAESMKAGIIADAQKAASDEKERAKREIETAKNSALSEITEKTVNMAFRVASDAVRREIKPDDHRSLIEDSIKQFESKN